MKGMMKKDPGVKKVETARWTKKEAGDKSGSGVYGTKRQNPQKQTWNLMDMRTETKQKKRCKRTDEGKREVERGLKPNFQFHSDTQYKVYNRVHHS